MNDTCKEILGFTVGLGIIVAGCILPVPKYMVVVAAKSAYEAITK